MKYSRLDSTVNLYPKEKGVVASRVISYLPADPAYFAVS